MSSKRILIIGAHTDPHVKAVVWALQLLQFESHVLDFSSFPSDLELGYAVDPREEFCENFHLATSHSLSSFSAVWNRRLGEPKLSAVVHKDDISVVQRESLAFVRGLCGLLEKHITAKWFNPFIAGVAAENKMLQLYAAKRVGFFIPRTLFSNAAIEIATFISQCSGDVVYKPFYAGQWEMGGGRIAALSAGRINKEGLNANQLRLCPGIYQEEVRKSADVRVLMCDNKHATLSISSKINDEIVDWRRAPDCELSFKADVAPAHIIRSCGLYCQSLGLKSAAFDFAIERTTGKWFFLEANQAGQFLWMEEVAPESRALACFVSGFTGMEVPDSISWSSFINAQMRESTNRDSAVN